MPFPDIAPADDVPNKPIYSAAPNKRLMVTKYNVINFTDNFFVLKHNNNCSMKNGMEQIKHKNSVVKSPV